MTKISGEVQTAQTAIEAMKNGLSKKGNKTSNTVNMNFICIWQNQVSEVIHENFVKTIFLKFGCLQYSFMN